MAKQPRSGSGESAKSVVARAARLVWSRVVRKKEAPAGASARQAAKKVSRAVKSAAKKVTRGAGSKKSEKKNPVKKAEPKKVAAKKPEKKVEKKSARVEKAPLTEVEQKPAAAPVARPRATKLPAVGHPLNKREMEQLLTAGQGRGVTGEGSLKGRLMVKDGFPYLHVVGRDKRELTFLLQGPDQEVLPAYVDHKVSVSGLIKKTNNYGGTVDVRKWTAKKPEAEAEAAEAAEQKLRFLSPGEIEQLITGGMGAGLTGFARFKGQLEMTGDDFFLVASGAGTRQQVSFLITGKAAKGLRKYVGQTLYVTGIAEKSSGWGGKLDLESFDVRPTEGRGMSRENLQVTQVEGLSSEPKTVDVVINQGLSVRLTEKAGHIWAIEPTVAKRVGLREANFEPQANGPATREFFFTPRNPGTFEVEFFLAKAFNPAQVSRSCKLIVNVKTHA
ncbi:MAG: transcriptional regulator [Myxococcaceae bacterium]|nr:transcriptional regulator [Myxococcaceae bacterium]